MNTVYCEKCKASLNILEVLDLTTGKISYICSKCYADMIMQEEY